ncbi:cell wall hydrolase [Prosthecochloris sp. GSB1]|uniref:cell wall hydrolase n=1 Tax=Prosthecochloris sp. GSB1 TaxID=281093 RepID=UPI000B8CADCE|nr:cell wall hydrolase [Prosthecochloris sp. GSB1]ASQ91683.1 cell wall hydrolase [Prosthecochloris sp. GSB1]
MNFMSRVQERTKAIPVKKAKALGGAVALAGLFSMGMAVKSHTSHHDRQKTAFQYKDYTKAFKSREMEWLARNIYHEARGESWDGMLAVGLVTLNRVNSPDYPESIEGVVKDYKQFSWYWDGLPDKIRDRKAWRMAKAAAAEVMLNPDLPLAKELAGVLFYHADYVAPEWAGAKTEVATIGAHVFYM